MTASKRILSAQQVLHNLAIFGDQFSGKRSASVGPSTGLVLSAEAFLTPAERDAVASSRALRNMVEAVLERRAVATLRAIRQDVRARKAIRTGTFLSAWTYKMIRSHTFTWRTSVGFYNPVPYAAYVHPKGTSRSQTIVNVDIKGAILPAARIALAQDLTQVRPLITAYVKAVALSQRPVRARGA